MRDIWIVAFIARRRRFWWDWCYSGPWRHVVAYRYDPTSRIWLAIDWNRQDLTVKAFTRENVAGLWVEHVNAGGMLMRWEGPEPGRRRASLLAWCVPVVAHAIGLCRRPWTPRQLASALRATGGTDFLLDDTAPVQEHPHVRSRRNQGPENRS